MEQKLGKEQEKKEIKGNTHGTERWYQGSPLITRREGWGITVPSTQGVRCSFYVDQEVEQIQKCFEFFVLTVGRHSESRSAQLLLEKQRRLCALELWYVTVFYGSTNTTLTYCTASCKFSGENLEPFLLNSILGSTACCPVGRLWRQRFVGKKIKRGSFIQRLHILGRMMGFCLRAHSL